VTGATFEGQNLTFLDRENFNNGVVEFWVLEEAKLQSVSPGSLSFSHTGNVPFGRTVSSVLLENVNQAALISATGRNGLNGTSITANLASEIGGFSVFGGMSRRANIIGSTTSPGWEPGLSQSNVRMTSFTAGKAYNTAINDSITMDFTGGNERMALLGKHFALADPTAPIGASVDSKSDQTFNLSWTSGSGTTDGFMIAYQVGPTAPADCNSGITDDIGDVVSYALNGLTADTEYSIRICAYNVQGDLEAGITVTDTTDSLPLDPPNEISNLNANAVSDTEITLNWFSGAGTTDGFFISYQLGATAPADCRSGTIVDADISTAFLIQSLQADTEYSFRVCAYNADDVHSTGLTVTETTDSGGSETSSIAGPWENGITRTAVQAGNNRILVFVVSSEDTVDANVTAVTFGGQPLTAVVEEVSINGDFGRVEIWYLLEAGLQAASGTTFDVTWSTGNLNRRLYSHAIYADIDQNAPVFDTSTTNLPAVGANPISSTVTAKAGGVSIAAATTGNDGVYIVI